MALDETWLQEADRLISDLEREIVIPDDRIHPLWLERLITQAVDKRQKSTNLHEKVRLVSLEIRARMIQEQWIKEKTKQN